MILTILVILINEFMMNDFDDFGNFNKKKEFMLSDFVKSHNTSQQLHTFHPVSNHTYHPYR